MCTPGDSSAEDGASSVSAHSVRKRNPRIDCEAMLLRHTPAACIAPQQRSHAHSPASITCTGATSNQHSQLGRTSRTGTRGAGCSEVSSRMVADITMAPSTSGFSAAAAVATAATLHCQVRRRQRAPVHSAPQAFRKHTTAAQQMCRCLVDATALPLSAPLQQQQPGEMALAAPACMIACKQLTPIMPHQVSIRECMPGGNKKHLNASAELRVLPMASAIVIRTAEPSDYWAIAVSGSCALFAKHISSGCSRSERASGTASLLLCSASL